jgi:hypothetical protein
LVMTPKISGGSERKQLANRRNSKLSTGPRNTSRTRLNALGQGIYSRECVIAQGLCREDPEDFDAFRTAMLRALCPEGALEELLADDLIQLAWRRRRIVRYETAVIAENLEMAGAGAEPLDGHYTSIARCQPSDDLRDWLCRCHEDLETLELNDPLDRHQKIAVRVEVAAMTEFDLSWREVLHGGPGKGPLSREQNGAGH